MSNRIVYRGATEIIEVSVTADDVEIADQTVHLSFDYGATWVAASWTSAAGNTRTASATIIVSDHFGRAMTRPVLVRVTDVPESPIVKAGMLQVY